MKKDTTANTSDQRNRKSNPLIKGTYKVLDGKTKKAFAYCAYHEGSIVAYDGAFEGEICVTLDVKSVIKSLKANKFI